METIEPMRRLAIWAGLGAWTAEAARVELARDGLRASGTQLGAAPVPYRADYELDATGPGFMTRHLRVAVAGEGWRRLLDLLRSRDGAWWCETAVEGGVALPAPGGDVAGLGADARDCDLARSPLTNLMPIRRNGLHERPGRDELTVAWVSLPDLAVTVAPQTYEHVRPGAVRFSEPDGFAAEIELDGDGLVVRYPSIARRIVATGAA